VIPTQHQKAGNQVRKDQKRRLQYQAKQQLDQQVTKDSKIIRSKWFGRIELSEGQVKSYLSKLIK